MIDVSIIIPTFNRRQDLIIALESVFGQPNVRVEVIVIDDCSDDGTVEFIREQYKCHQLVVIEKPNRSGPQVSRNLGIAFAHGEFITFLDSDDYFEPDTLAGRVMRCRELQLDALFSGYRVKFIGRRWDLIKSVKTVARTCPVNYTAALRDFKIAPMITIMYRRAMHECLKLDEGLASGHDDDLSLYLIKSSRYAFDDILASTIIQHVGGRVATPKNLMIGDAQLLKKYSGDISRYQGHVYLTRRLAKALAGLWSVGQFKQTINLWPEGLSRSASITALALGIIYLPQRLLEVMLLRAKMAAVRLVL